MGKKKHTGEYNDYLDGEKLRDNNEVWTSLQGPSSRIRASSPPTHQHQRTKKHEKGKDGPKKPPLTHFLCLPLVTEASRSQLQLGLEKLRTDLEKDSLVPPKAVRPLGTLHLTLGVMSLNDTKLEEAKQYLQDLNLYTLLRDITTKGIAEKAAEDGTISENLNAAGMPDTESLTVNLQALIPMHSPQNTSILYASPRDETQRLVPFAEVLKTRFTQEGFMVDDSRPLKLHATVINTIYAKSGGRSQGHGPDAKSWMRFDARGLIEEYKEFVWAEGLSIDRVQICKMGAKKIWSGGVEGEGEVVDERYEIVCEKMFE